MSRVRPENQFATTLAGYPRAGGRSSRPAEYQVARTPDRYPRCRSRRAPIAAATQERLALRYILSQIARESRGLQFRSTILLTAVVAMASALTGMLYLHVTSRLMVERGKTRTRLLAKSIAVSSAAPLKARDHDELLKVAQNLMEHQHIVYVAFADVDGTIVAGAQLGAGHITHWLYGDGNRIAVQPVDQPALVSDERLGSRIDVVYPVEDLSPDAKSMVVRPIIGFVRLGVNMAPDEKTLFGVARQVTGIALGVVLLMVPLGFEIVRRIVAPINEISRASLELAGGRLDTRVGVQRSDEIGRLAQSFNRMADDLQHSHSALMKLNAELELRVQRRTRQLQEANRLLQIDMAEREEFLRAVSHDLHAPLRNITGQIMLVKRKAGSELPDAADHHLQRIEHNVQYAINMIDELLELSRVRTTREPAQEFDLDTEIRAIAEQLECELDRKSVCLKIDGPLPTIVAERRRMRQLFQNLLDNAIKYTPDSEPSSRPREVTIQFVEGPDEFEFRVADRGIGIRPEDRQAIFNVFNRARTDFVSRTPGKGVGLAHCKSIVQRYGGHIWVEDNPGGGSVFCFTLRKSAMVSQAEAARADEGSAGSIELVEAGA